MRWLAQNGTSTTYDGRARYKKYRVTVNRTVRLCDSFSDSLSGRRNGATSHARAHRPAHRD